MTENGVLQLNGELERVKNYEANKMTCGRNEKHRKWSFVR
jgi:hypothetical protein